MKEFDYKRAWTEIAKPAFEALPQNVRDLYDRVCVEMEIHHQNPNRGFSLDWPEMDGRWPDSLKTAFAQIPAEVLFDAQEIIFNYGHWSSEKHSYRGAGGTWKFQILARQSLIERNWNEAANWKVSSWRTPRFSEEVIDSYMVETDPKVIATEKRRRDAIVKLRAVIVAPYEVEKIDGVTHPHPFVIGPQHFPKDGGMYIRPEQAPCADPRCRMDYGKHITEDTLFVQTPELLRDRVPDDLAAMLVEAKPIMEEAEIKGVAFPPKG